MITDSSWFSGLRLVTGEGRLMVDATCPFELSDGKCQGETMTSEVTRCV
jgi:hypothetical protein